MPVLIIYGMPEEVQPKGCTKLLVAPYLADLVKTLQKSVGEILCIPGDEVSVFFPTDRMDLGLGEELVCSVERLFRFENPANDDERLKRKEVAVTILHDLKTFVGKYLSECKEISVMVKRFNYEDGFASCDVP